MKKLPIQLIVIVSSVVLVTTISASAIYVHERDAAKIAQKTLTSKKVSKVKAKQNVHIVPTKAVVAPQPSPAPSTTQVIKSSPPKTTSTTKTSGASNPPTSNASLSQTPYLDGIWTGYEVLGSKGEYTMAQGTIVVPTVSCSNQYTQFSLWVGLDGADSGNTVEQEGIRAMCETPGSCLTDCSSATPSYFIWTEMYPLDLVQQSLSISPGDTIFMKVSYISSSNNYELYFDNESTGGTYTSYQACPSGNTCQNSTAEWISENHLKSGTPISLFGTAAFTNAEVGTAQNANPTPFTNFTNYPVEAYVNGEQQESVSYPLARGATSFTINQLVND